ncbi:MAG: TIGR01906 family membrane protein [Ruminococcaceae bacterium]|nr:TIGR01906 family membrane protein [Oscillospiraceae bacterium]
MKKRLLSVLCAVCVFLFLLTASIALPIYIRPFYYAHIDGYDLAERSGFSETEIRQAYDEVLDYLTLPGKPFGTGVMACSHEAEHHFADCRVLFELNAMILIGSAAILAVLFAMRKRWGPYRLGKHSAPFWAAVLALVAPVVIGALAAMDFDRAFVIFHSIFFPGKTNWIFDWNADQIIRVLPQEFFRNCAILIGAGLVTMSGGILIWENLKRKKEQA